MSSNPPPEATSGSCGPQRDNRNPGHRGGRGGRGRGWRGRGGRGPATHQPPAESFEHTSAANPTDGPDEDIPVNVADAFSRSFPTQKRVRERGRAFVLPVPSATGGAAADAPPGDASRERVFLVVERTIVGLDDIVYEKDRQVWEDLPRGNARVFVLTSSPTAAATEQQLLQIASAREAGAKNRGTSLAIARRDVVAVAAINGLRKFSYNDLKEGSTAPTAATDQDYGYEADVQRVIALEKENGECGHLSGFVLPQESALSIAAEHSATATTVDDGTADPTAERYWVIGSKNVHIVLPYSFTAADIERYKSRRYSYARKIAQQWMRVMRLADVTHSAAGAAAADATGADEAALYRNVSPAKLLKLHDVLSRKRYTACFEAIFNDSQHLVDYQSRNELRFFAVTANDTYESREGGAVPTPPSSYAHGLCLDIHESFAILAECGLPTAPVFSPALRAPVSVADGALTIPATPYRSAEYVALIDAIGHRENSEGCVIYGYGADARVLKVWKAKAYPYVMERATREAIVTHNLAGKRLEAKIQKKLALQNPLIRKYFADWEKTRLPFLVLFSAYLHLTRTLTPSMSKDDAFMRVRNRWLTLQREFAASLEADMELRSACEQFVPGEGAEATESDGNGGSSAKGKKDALPKADRLRLDVVKFVGAQGCGKSTLSRVLIFLLTEANYSPRWLNQDEACGRSNYLAAIRQAVLDSPLIGQREEAKSEEVGAGAASVTTGPGASPSPARKLTHVILDKMNLDARTNADYDCLPEPAVTAFFTYETDPEEEYSTQERARTQASMTDVLLSRVVNRGSGHRTIRIAAELTPQQQAEEKQKIRKFLSMAVRSCTVPKGDKNLIFLDVTDSIETQIGCLWEAMQQNGFYDLPDLSTLHVQTAIDVSARYERLLTRQVRPPLYASLSIAPDDYQKVMAVVPLAVLRGKTVQPSFHVTTKFFPGDPSPLFLVALAELEGKTIPLTLDAVGANEKAVAIRVRHDRRLSPAAEKSHASGESTVVYQNDIMSFFLPEESRYVTDYPCGNAVAHITVARAAGVPAKYSGELLAVFASDADVVRPIDGTVTVRGTFTFNYLGGNG